MSKTQITAQHTSQLADHKEKPAGKGKIYRQKKTEANHKRIERYSGIRHGAPRLLDQPLTNKMQLQMKIRHSGKQDMQPIDKI